MRWSWGCLLLVGGCMFRVESRTGEGTLAGLPGCEPSASTPELQVDVAQRCVGEVCVGNAWDPERFGKQGFTCREDQGVTRCDRPHVTLRKGEDLVLGILLHGEDGSVAFGRGIGLGDSMACLEQLLGTADAAMAAPRPAGGPVMPYRVTWAEPGIQAFDGSSPDFWGIAEGDGRVHFLELGWFYEREEEG